jgi:predicted DNA-binding protein
VEEKVMKQAIFTKSLTISMPPENYEQIKQITDAKQISMAEWVREAVYAALEKYQPQGDTIDDQ